MALSPLPRARDREGVACVADLVAEPMTISKQSSWDSEAARDVAPGQKIAFAPSAGLEEPMIGVAGEFRIAEEALIKQKESLKVLLQVSVHKS